MRAVSRRSWFLGLLAAAMAPRAARAKPGRGVKFSAPITIATTDPGSFRRVRETDICSLARAVRMAELRRNTVAAAVRRGALTPEAAAQLLSDPPFGRAVP